MWFVILPAIVDHFEWSPSPSDEREWRQATLLETEEGIALLDIEGSDIPRLRIQLAGLPLVALRAPAAAGPLAQERWRNVAKTHYDWFLAFVSDPCHVTASPRWVFPDTLDV